MTLKESFAKNKIGIILMLISSCFTATGQLIWKLSEASNIYLVILGFVAYGIGALLMIMAFKHGSLSVLHPLLSFGYALAVVLGFVFLAEPISVTKVLGIVIIISGVIMMGGSDV